MVDSERLAAILAKLAQTLITDYDVSDVLHDLCGDVNGLLRVNATGVMLTDSDGVLRVAAASDEEAALVEQLQLETDEGPCLTAYREQAPVVVSDLTTSERFPAFGPQALELGMKSVAGFPMQVHGRHIGALGVYRHGVVGFDEAFVEAAETLAASATAYILNCRALDEAVVLSDQLRHALESRIIIEQAKGKLSEQVGVDVATAFELMRRHARNHGRKLQTVARDVLDGRLVIQLGQPPD